MRKIYLIAGLWAALFSAKAQQIATFEEIDLQPDSYYNGSDGAGGFQSGGIWFPNDYNADWGSWSGFAVSNMKDTITAGYENQYSAATAMGADSSGTYSVVYINGNQKLSFDNPVNVEGFYITNSVYAYLSIRDGNDWAKQFGGASGTDPDYFLLHVSGLDASGNVTDTLEFYLADFRFEDSVQDYIVDEWHWFDLTSLGAVSELNFSMESTDMGDWGMNTPAYFCIDNFTVSDIASYSTLLSGNQPAIKIFPNPVKDKFWVQVSGPARKVILYDGMGKVVWQDNLSGQEKYTVSALENMPSGIYYMQVKAGNGITSQKIIKY